MLLPDLVFDVLLRLPVKSLLRSRCLSKLICAEIDSANFVNNHLKRSTETKTHQKLIINEASSFYAADVDDSLREITALPLCCPLKYSQSVTVVCGSVLNGLILLGTIPKLGRERVQFILWNPFTRRYKNIPSYGRINLCNFNSFGLGYDSTVDDYKIVMILRDFNHKGFVPKALVFSLKSNSWRRIEDVAGLFARSRAALTTGSALYWSAFNYPYNDVKILGFDIASEVFFNFRLLSCFCTRSMLVLDGKLYVSRVPDDGETQEFYLGMSDKDGEEAGVNWRKAFVMHKGDLNKRGDYLSGPLTYSKEGDNILLCNRNKLSWYNPEKETRQIIDINISLCGYRYNVCSESLVSLGCDTAFDEEAEEVLVDKLNMKT
ncbi:hypothetical protein SLA2020_112310 [Shorea laevis]